MSGWEVKVVGSCREERAFLQLPYDLYKEDPNWVPPLRSSERKRWQAKHNESVGRMRVVRLVAWKSGKPVGRIAAMVDPLFDRWVPGSGYFGFFECVDDVEVSRALLTSAEEVLRGWGRSLVFGPVNHTTHDEVGVLVEGFGLPPTVLSPYNLPYYSAHITQAGYEPFRDYFAFEWTPSTPTGRSVKRLIRSVDTSEGTYRDIRIRPLDSSNWEADVRTFHELYNTCFSDVWGFVETSWRESLKKAEGFRRFYHPELAVLAERHGQAVGFALVLPDLNTVLAKLRGRLLPFGWYRARSRIPKIRTGRFILAGVRPGSEGQGLAPAMVLYLQDRAMKAGFTSVEVALVQASNQRMLNVVKAFGCQRTKTIRLFQKNL